MTASTAALLTAIAHANLATYQRWIAFSARMFEQTQEGMQIAFEVCVERPLAAMHAATVQASAATTVSCRETTCAQPWMVGAAYLGHPAMTCLVAEYSSDMDPLTFAAGRSGA